MVPYLGYDGESRPEVLQPEAGDVLAINQDAATSSLDDTEQTQCERGLPGTCAAYDANLEHTCPESEGDIGRV